MVKIPCPACRRNQREALAAYRIRRHRPRISASFSGTRCRKHSHAADIRYCLLADGLERINDSMLTSIPSRNTVFRFSGIPTPFQDVNDCAYHSTRSTRSTQLTTKYALAPWGMQPNTSPAALSPRFPWAFPCSCLCAYYTIFGNFWVNSCGRSGSCMD